MKRNITRLVVLVFPVLLAVSTVGFTAEGNKAAPVTTQSEIENVNDSAEPNTPAQSAIKSSAAGAKAGEEINWQVISSGGLINGISGNYRLSGTAGQTAVGTGTGGDMALSHGFWQVFGCCDTPGDANNDGACNIGDEVFLGNFVFRSGQCDDPPGNPIGCPPECMAEGDANADGGVNIGDEVFLGNYIFRPPPASPFPECGPE